MNESTIKPWEFATSSLPWHVKEANRFSIYLYCLPCCWCLLNGCRSIQEPQPRTAQGSSPWSDKVSVRPVHNSEASSADRITAESTAASRHGLLENQYRQGQKRTISCMQNKQEQGVNQYISEKPAPKTANEKFLRRVRRRNMPMWLCRLRRRKTKHQHSWNKLPPEICSTPTDRLCRHHHNSLWCWKTDLFFSYAPPRLLSSNKCSLSSGLPVYWRLPRVVWPRLCLNPAKLSTVAVSHPLWTWYLASQRACLSKFSCIKRSDHMDR